MKITFIYNQCFLGGTEAAIKNRMDYLVDMGIDCEILFLYPGCEDETFKNHKYHVAENCIKIRNILKNSDFVDILSPLDTIFRKLYRMDKPIIHECHCPGYYSYLSNLDSKKIKAIIFPSKSQMESAKRFTPKKIPSFYLYNCLGKDFISGTYNTKIQNKKIILWVGRIEQRKNWRFLIELAKYLSGDYIIRVVTNYMENTEYNKFLEIRKGLGLENKIEIITDCPYENMLSHYVDAAAGGCHLSSASSESFGMTVIEAIYAGCPLVLTDLPVFREVAGDSAEYYSINNITECIDKIQKVCSNVNFRNEIIKKGIKRYNSLYNPKVICQEFIDIINTLSF